jgi:ubiquinone biosynthesis accessory factor UbiK
MKQPAIDEFVSQFMKLLPEDLRHLKADLDKNVRAALGAAFARMDLVTREEFDVQSALLGRTRELLERLELKVRELEREQQNRTQEHPNES